MAKTLFELAQEYLNQGMPDISQTPRVVTPPPATTMPVPIPPGGSPTARILPMPQGGGGGDFGVYNPDPNSTRTQNNYSPYSYRQAAAKSGVGIPSGILSDSSFLYPPQTKVGNMIGNSFLGKGLDYLGSKMPVNRTGILQNELLGAGFQLNDIGQIVSNDVNTVEGVMSGYNTSKMDASTFDNRIEKIKNRKAPQTKASRQKISLIEQAKNKFLSASDKSTDVFENKMIEKDPSLKGPDYLKDSFNFTTNKDENNIFAAKDKLTDPNITPAMINEFGFGGEYGSSDDNFPSAPPTTVDMINEFGYGGNYGLSLIHI